MYRVSYEKLLEILNEAGCGAAIAGLEEKEITPDAIRFIEIDFTIEDEGTEDEITTVSEFNIYTENNTVLFGVQFKHENDFYIQWARTNPYPNYKTLEPLPEKKDQEFTDEAKKALDFLRGIEFDQEYNDPEDTKEFWEYYDEAFRTMYGLFNRYTAARETIDRARTRLCDLSRVIEKMGDGEDLDIITKRIDEIYTLLKGE